MPRVAMLRTSLAGNGVIATPTEIGCVGREGLFFMPGLVASDITWAVDFYKLYVPRLHVIKQI